MLAGFGSVVGSACVVSCRVVFEFEFLPLISRLVAVLDIDVSGVEVEIEEGQRGLILSHGRRRA